jgi:predicted NBD/HSP70 family sugar kinase
LSKPESGSVRNANFRCGIGVDVGGTFTDVAIVHPGGVWRAKSPTTHGDVGRGVIAGIELASADAGLSVAQLLPRVERFGLGTTAVTNVIAEHHPRIRERARAGAWHPLFRDGTRARPRPDRTAHQHCRNR